MIQNSAAALKVTSIKVFGFVLTSPVSSLTNLGLAFVGFWLARRLRAPGSTAAWHWSRFLSFTALGALLGVAKHGLKAYMEGGSATAILVLTNVALGAAVYHAEIATVRTYLGSSEVGRTLTGVIRLQLAAFVAVVLVQQAFLVVVVHATLGLMPVLLVELRAFVGGRQDAAWIFSGLAVSCLSAVVYLIHFSVGPWLDPISVAHVTSAASLVCLYRGARSRLEGSEAGTRFGAGQYVPAQPERS